MKKKVRFFYIEGMTRGPPKIHSQTKGVPILIWHVSNMMRGFPFMYLVGPSIYFYGIFSYSSLTYEHVLLTSVLLINTSILNL